MMFRGNNFEVTREFTRCGVTVYEYLYNFKRYFTDTWPPPIVFTKPPITKVVTEDGEDVTRDVLKYAGPRKNIINPLSLVVFKWRLTCGLSKRGGVSIQIKKVPELWHGQITVTDFFNKKNTISL
jgi:hypothetical protein